MQCWTPSRSSHEEQNLRSRHMARAHTCPSSTLRTTHRALQRPCMRAEQLADVRNACWDMTPDPLVQNGSPRTSCERRALAVGVEGVAHALRRSLHNPVCRGRHRRIVSTNLQELLFAAEEPHERKAQPTPSDERLCRFILVPLPRYSHAMFDACGMCCKEE